MLKRQTSLWEGVQEVVKSSCRNESIWVLIPLCMEAMLGISLYIYPYVKLAKTLCLSYYCLCLLFNKIEEEGRAGSAWKRRVWGRGEGRDLGAGGRNGSNNICAYELKKKICRLTQSTLHRVLSRTYT
jgi:hypothetical protein